MNTTNLQPHLSTTEIYLGHTQAMLLMRFLVSELLSIGSLDSSESNVKKVIVRH